MDDSHVRLDLLIDERLVVEVKHVGLLINFNVKYLGEGAIRRLVSGYRGPLPRVQRAPR